MDEEDEIDDDDDVDMVDDYEGAELAAQDGIGSGNTNNGGGGGSARMVGVSRGVAGILSNIVQRGSFGGVGGSGNHVTGSLLSSVGRSVTPSRASSGVSDTGSSGASSVGAPFALPVVSFATIGAVAAELEALAQRDGRATLVQLLMEGDHAYVTRLFELREEAEDLGDTDTLAVFHRIILSLMLCVDGLLYDLLTSEELFESTLACFEVVPAVGAAAAVVESTAPGVAVGEGVPPPPPPVVTLTPPPQLRRYREYMKQSVTFREAVPINNPDLLKRIHQNFRLQFLKGA